MFGSAKLLHSLLLLLLAEEPDYGYDLAAKLKDFGLPVKKGCSQLGRIYRILASLEQGGYITCAWDTSVSPPRKIYRITNLGLRHLREAGARMQQRADLLQRFCRRVADLPETTAD